jgi:peptidoglycan L-alanyl-D-glutamate endopeptidase CwlK
MDPHIRDIQEALEGLGYTPGPIDGLWGPRTEIAVRELVNAKGRPAAPPAPAPATGFLLDARSDRNLAGVHGDLVSVVRRAAKLSPVRFTVIEGLRTIERQRELVAKGASKTMNSRHLTGHAVDLVPLDERGVISWAWPLYHQLAPFVKQAARELGVAIEWGGDWRSFKDGPHWQLPWSAYPA